MELTRKNIIAGAAIYCIGDTVAALMLDEFSLGRMAGMILIGGTLYAFEISNYFNWIEKRTAQFKGVRRWMGKTLWAMLYFNPLWITRHLFFIKLFSGEFDDLTTELFKVGLLSFIVNVPIALVGNYIVQNMVKLSSRFIASSIFSAIMAIYFALSFILFNK